MTEYCAKAKSYERYVLQSYIERYSTFYGVSATWIYMTAIAFVVGTLFLSQPFPTEAEYPFPVDYEPVRLVLYVHQAYVAMQCAAIVCVNVFAALLLLFAAALFESLMMDLRAVQNFETLIECVKKYYHTRRYVTMLLERLVLSRTTSNSLFQVRAGSGYVCSVHGTFHDYSIQLSARALRYSYYRSKYATIAVRNQTEVRTDFVCFVQRQPIAIKVQFVFLALTALVEVFMCAWPADNLMHVVSCFAILSFDCKEVWL